MTAEGFSDGAKDLVPDDHVFSRPIFGTLRYFQLNLSLLALLLVVFLLTRRVLGSWRSLSLRLSNCLLLRNFGHVASD